jgi:hypothetical protein
LSCCHARRSVAFRGCPDVVALAAPAVARSSSLSTTLLSASALAAGTLSHYRNWAAQLQARYQLFNPDAARPAKRV